MQLFFYATKVKIHENILLKKQRQVSVRCSNVDDDRERLDDNIPTGRPNSSLTIQKKSKDWFLKNGRFEVPNS